MDELLTNPIITGAAATLGIGIVFLVLFATGKLPTPAERTTLKETIVQMREDHRAELAIVRQEAQTELTTVRVNLRKDLEAERASVATQIDRERAIFQRQLDAKDVTIKDNADYVKHLVQEMSTQQEAIQHDVVPPLALVAQQLPPIMFMLQEVNRKKAESGN